MILDIKIPAEILQADLSDKAKILYGFILANAVGGGSNKYLNFEITSTDLARALKCDPRTINRLLAELEAKHYIERFWWASQHAPNEKKVKLVA
ncbi:MAG: helix-turn-helix domain-containing protein [Firmicutes bacterium]|nr:helix-turn-helix domain-containing protein [Bacillota bacterium]